MIEITKESLKSVDIENLDKMLQAIKLELIIRKYHIVSIIENRDLEGFQNIYDKNNETTFNFVIAGLNSWSDLLVSNSFSGYKENHEFLEEIILYLTKNKKYSNNNLGDVIIENYILNNLCLSVDSVVSLKKTCDIINNSDFKKILSVQFLSMENISSIEVLRYLRDEYSQYNLKGHSSIDYISIPKISLHERIKFLKEETDFFINTDVDEILELLDNLRLTSITQYTDSLIIEFFKCIQDLFEESVVLEIYELLLSSGNKDNNDKFRYVSSIFQKYGNNVEIYEDIFNFSKNKQETAEKIFNILLKNKNLCNERFYEIVISNKLFAENIVECYRKWKKQDNDVVNLEEVFFNNMENIETYYELNNLESPVKNKSKLKI